MKSTNTQAVENEFEATPFEGDADHATVEAIGGHSVADLPQHYYRSVRFIGTFISFPLGYQSAALAAIMPANILTTINDRVGPSNDYVWVLLVFILCQVVVLAIAGRLSDVFGRRWFFLGANCMAFVGFLVCSRAQNINTLIGGSVISGLGSGVQMQGILISGELVPNEHRFLALGFCFLLLGPMFAVAPGLAQVFVAAGQNSWRWVYYLPAILAGLAASLQLVFYQPPNFKQLHTVMTKREVLKTLDYGGLVIFGGSMFSLLLGISWGGQAYSWRSYKVITTIVIGAVGRICFIFYEHLSKAKQPLMPLYLFKNRNYVVLSLCASVATAMFYGLNIIWPQQISALYAGSGKSGAWMACTLTAGVIFGQALGSLLVKRIGKTKWQLVVACCILTAFSSGMAGITEKTKGMAIAFSCISSTMIGYLDIICLAGAILEVDAKDIGLASGVAFTFRTALSSLADSIYVSILENKIKSNVPKYCIPAALSEGLPKGSLTDLLTAVDNGTASALEAVPGMTPSILAAVSKGLLVAYEKSFQMIYFAAISFGLVAIISAGLSSNVDSKLTTEIARKLQGFRQASDKIDEAKGGSIELERQ